MLMEWLMLATGFTGALTCVFLLRLLHRCFADVATVTAYFSPKGGCADAVVDQLGRAKKEVLILAHSFAFEKLSKVVLDAKMRGVRVELVLDKHNEKDPASDLHVFAGQGLAPCLNTQSPCCHDNLMLIDGRVVITGSFDFTRQAEEENSDSVLIIAGHPALLSACRKHFQDAKSHAKEFSRPSTPKPVEKTDAVPRIDLPPTREVEAGRKAA